MQDSTTRETIQEHVDRRLIIRQLIFIVIILILITLNIRSVMRGDIGIILASSSFLLATIVGILLSRIFKISWHEEKSKVIAKLDTTGAILLVFYILFEVNRKWFFGYWLKGETVNVFGLIVLSGLLLGRFLGTSIKIKRVLTENDKLN